MPYWEWRSSNRNGATNSHAATTYKGYHFKKTTNNVATGIGFGYTGGDGASTVDENGVAFDKCPPYYVRAFL
jgi:hypothetical protein